MKRFAIAAALAALALPGQAVAAEPGSERSASQACREQRAALGDAAFKAAYGTNRNRSNAFGKCVSRQQRAERAMAREAREACREQGLTGRERAACVRAAVREEREERNEATADAAQECKTERRADRRAFEQRYGTNRNKRNAFGRCVSTKVRDAEREEDTAPTTGTPS